MSVQTIAIGWKLDIALSVANDFLPMNVIGETTNWAYARLGQQAPPVQIKRNPINKPPDLDVMTVEEVMQSEGRSWLG